MEFEFSTEIERIILQALQEDVGAGDATSQAIIPADAVGSFAFVAREEMVLCGVQIAKFLLPNLQILAHDGQRLQVGEAIAKISGNVRQILQAERVALNFLQHLSGIATLTSKYVAEIAHTQTQIFDTRKTTPCLRELEKYAVRCGGGQNHRMRLDDMVLIKDNHISAAGGIAVAVAKARGTGLPIMLEVDNLQQLEQAIAAKPDYIMLDNFSLSDLRQAVQMVGGQIPLEASGGVNLQTVRAIAETGVQRISTSKITQGAPAVDIGLDEC